VTGMPTSIFITLFVLLTQDNFVPDSSFEEYRIDFCGLTPSIEKFKRDNTYWRSPTYGNPNIYSKTVEPHCWNHIRADSPDQPRTGNRMLMICTYGSKDFRSYAQVKLKEPLQKQRRYILRFWLKVPSDADAFSPNIGILLSTDARIYDTTSNIQERPTVEFSDWNPGGWVMIEGKFWADEAFGYLTIGNFRSNSDSKLVMLVNESDDRVSWLFIDDVELYCE